MPAMCLLLIASVQPIAPAQALRDIHKYWGSHQMIPTQWIMIAAGLLLLLMSGLSLYQLWHTRHQRTTPLWVFHRLAKQFGLGLRDQWLLYRIAQQQALPTPLTLMLSPDTLAHHAHAYVQHHSPGRAQATRQRADTIAHHLFGEDA